MKVAYYSPLPPERSGIADYSALLLPELEKRLDVAVVKRGSRRRPRGSDVALYHVGNNADAHAWIVDALRRERGLVVLHDYVLHHLIGGMTLGRGDPDGYLDAMQREGGIVGRLLGHAVVDELIPPLWESRAHEFPLAGTVLDRADGVIVHSHYVDERAREAGYAGPIWRVPLAATPDPPSIAVTLPEGRSPIVGCLGNLNPAKRIPELLAAFARLRQEHPSALLVLAGAPSPGFDIEAPLKEHGLRAGEDVLVRGYVAEDELWGLIAACDFCVNLRWPTMGETSAAAVQVLTLGRPLVVSDVGWFSELPDDVAIKVPVDGHEPDALADALARLAEDPALRQQLGESAIQYVAREHSLTRAADLYVGAIEDSLGRGVVLDQVLGEVGQAAAEVGLSPNGDQLGALGKRIRETGLGG
ncbi:MAG: glycosyltransferase family 4 protein [Actinomycetota bacterium]